jgi:hypothetical protein
LQLPSFVHCDANVAAIPQDTPRIAIEICLNVAGHEINKEEVLREIIEVKSPKIYFQPNETPTLLVTFLKSPTNVRKFLQVPAAQIDDFFDIHVKALPVTTINTPGYPLEQKAFNPIKSLQIVESTNSHDLLRCWTFRFKFRKRKDTKQSETTERGQQRLKKPLESEALFDGITEKGQQPQKRIRREEQLGKDGNLSPVSRQVTELSDSDQPVALLNISIEPQNTGLISFSSFLIFLIIFSFFFFSQNHHLL